MSKYPPTKDERRKEKAGTDRNERQKPPREIERRYLVPVPIPPKPNPDDGKSSNEKD